METDDYFKSWRLRVKDKNVNYSYKVRKGKVGRYMDYLSERDIDYVNNLINKIGCRFETHPYYKHIRLFKNHYGLL